MKSSRNILIVIFCKNMKMAGIFELFLIVTIVQITAGISDSQKNAAEKTIQGLVGNDLIRFIPPIPNKEYKDAKLTNINVLKLTLPSVKITETGSTITIGISNFGVTASADWSAKKKIAFITLRARGTIKASASGVGMSLTLRKSPLKVQRCSDWIKSISVDIKGKNIAGKILSWLTKVFRKIVERFLKSQLRGKLCRGATKLIDKNASKISQLLGL